MIEAIERPQDVIWAGVTSEMMGQWTVTALYRRNLAPQPLVVSHQHAGTTFWVRCMDRRHMDTLLRRPGLAADLLTLPIDQPILIDRGFHPIDAYAAAANPHVIPGRLAAEMSGDTANWCTKAITRPNVHAIGALHARAYYAFAAQNDRLPTQAEFTDFVRARREPWARAVERASRTPEDLTETVLRARLIEQQPPMGSPFVNTEWIPAWGAEVDAPDPQRPPMTRQLPAAGARAHPSAQPAPPPPRVPRYNPSEPGQCRAATPIIKGPTEDPFAGMNF